MVAIEQYIRDIPDFPKQGVVFKDITPLLASAEATAFCLSELLKFIEGQRIDKVVGIESRGFFFATLLANELQAGFVPIRKPGKLPYNTLKQPYTLEYGMDALEIHEDAIQKGDKVLMHDDVLATGGTARAACKLIEKLGGEIVQCNFLIELSFLKGAEKLNKYELRAMLTY
ncbi:adenine phosphoribosyltransferase [Ulvibacter sp. MAR_2010_11]|uniref:adenine phosphoribosyltransferase n=1 Tax=Ulvibacter sp. MAR_2010_11 TaxID=1250229 RepID=UPI000C2C8699|nr:adenine phosphoribosyltransferase [Ulvibacter sp. MAR_2010_11]PKA82226.1 adenine phosphoribosyltransferase [Ulvibacter sp. MAR_2010_11]